MNVKAVPERYRSVTPYAVVEGADQMIEFLQTVFGAEETVRLPGANRNVVHVEDVSEEEMARRAYELASSAAPT